MKAVILRPALVGRKSIYFHISCKTSHNYILEVPDAGECIWKLFWRECNTARTSETHRDEYCWYETSEFRYIFKNINVLF